MAGYYRKLDLLIVSNIENGVPITPKYGKYSKIWIKKLVKRKGCEGELTMSRAKYLKLSERRNSFSENLTYPK